MTTTTTPEQADILPAEAIDLDALAELARKATPGPWIRSGIQQRMTEKSLGAGPDGRLLFFSPLGATNNDQAQCIRDMDFIAALDPTTVLALIDLARRADDHYFAVDYTGCIHEAPDRETAIKWAEDFARTANGGAIGSERPEVAAAIGSLARRAAVPSEQEPVAWVHNLTKIVRFDKPSIGLKDGDYTPLYTHPAPAAGVRVKALEWVRSSWARPNYDGTLSRAESVFGTYRVWTNPETGKWFWRLSDAPLGREPSGTADNEPAAKAAAQADYEARILSALDTGEPK